MDLIAEWLMIQSITTEVGGFKHLLVGFFLSRLHPLLELDFLASRLGAICPTLVGLGSFHEKPCCCLVTLVTRLSVERSRGATIAAKIGQAMVTFSEITSLHGQLQGGRRLNSQSLECESHTLFFGYHATTIL